MAEFEIGQQVEYKGERHNVTDVDEGYDYLALDGDKYVYPNAPENRCVSASMKECKIIKVSEANPCIHCQGGICKQMCISN